MLTFKISASIDIGGIHLSNDYMYNYYSKVFYDAGIKTGGNFSLDTAKLELFLPYLERELKKQIEAKKERDLHEEIWFQERPIIIFGQEIILNGYRSEDDVIDTLYSFYKRIIMVVEHNGIMFFEYIDSPPS